jgi:hypothetical protein
MFNIIKLFSYEFNVSENFASIYFFLDELNILLLFLRSLINPNFPKIALDIPLNCPYTLLKNTIEHVKATNRKSIWRWPGAESRVGGNRHWRAIEWAWELRGKHLCGG